MKHEFAVLVALSVPAMAYAQLPLQVQRASDFPTEHPFGEAAHISEAFQPQPVSAVPPEFTIVGVNVADAANRPGRVDERERVLHTGIEIRFLEETLPTLPPPRLKPGWMLSHHIDVGQGNATLLEFSCGLVLIDTGGQKTDAFDGPARLAEYLEQVFRRRPELNRTIATIFLTHPHKDHTEGVNSLLAASPSLRIGGVVANAKTSGSGFARQKALIDFGRAANVPVSLITNESIRRSDGFTNSSIDALRCQDGDPDVRVLWGSDSGAHGWASEPNNHSVVIRVDYGESSFLFTGDMEETAQAEFVGSYVRNPDIIDADVYQVGHHGSKNGTTAALLRVMLPEIAVIGSGNPADEEPGFSAYNFGHPNRVAIELLSNSQFGVTMTRPRVTVPVGISGRRPGRNSTPPRYAQQQLEKAIFSTGWDGDVIIAAELTGRKIVQVR